MDENQLIYEIEDTLTKEYEAWLDSLDVESIEDLDHYPTRRNHGEARNV